MHSQCLWRPLPHPEHARHQHPLAGDVLLERLRWLVRARLSQHERCQHLEQRWDFSIFDPEVRLLYLDRKYSTSPVLLFIFHLPHQMTYPKVPPTLHLHPDSPCRQHHRTAITLQIPGNRISTVIFIVSNGGIQSVLVHDFIVIFTPLTLPRGKHAPFVRVFARTDNWQQCI